MWLCGFYYGPCHVESCIVLFFRVLFSPVKHYDHLAWEIKSWSISKVSLSSLILSILFKDWNYYFEVSLSDEKH